MSGIAAALASRFVVSCFFSIACFVIYVTSRGSAHIGLLVLQFFLHSFNSKVINVIFQLHHILFYKP